MNFFPWNFSMSPPPRPIPSPHPPPHVFDIAPKLFVIQRFPSQFGKKPKKKFMFLKFLYVRLVKFSSTSIPVPRPRSRYLHFCYFPNRNCMWFRGFLHNLERNLKKNLCSWNFSMSNWWSSLVLESPAPVPQFWYLHFCYFPNQNCVYPSQFGKKP